MTTTKLNRIIIATSVVGVLLSTYALYVEMAAESRPGYKALCDISERASCSRVLTSKYSKGLGIVPKASFFEVPNCIYGIIFYCIMIELGTFDNKMAIELQFALALISVAISVYLAYLMAFVLYDFCIVCVSTYFVNVTLAFLLMLTITFLCSVFPSLNAFFVVKSTHYNKVWHKHCDYIDYIITDMDSIDDLSRSSLRAGNLSNAQIRPGRSLSSLSTSFDVPSTTSYI